jgi:phosphatidate cytidylyltransferase
MRLRWISAAIGIPLFLGLCVWGRLPFSLGILALAVLGAAEMLRAYRAQDIRANALLAGLGAFGPFLWFADPVGYLTASGGARYTLAFLFTLSLLAVIYEVWDAGRTGRMQAGRNLAYGMLCGAYISLFGSLIALRQNTTPVQAGWFPGMERGAALALVAVLCVWATDTLALYTGRALGRRKLAPNLSPNKTVEGSLGGLIGALAAGAIFGYGLRGSLPAGLFIGLIAGIFGQIGDLFESALKREAGIKDFGSLLPGHGGVLDRFDSLLFTATLVAALVQ